MSYMDITPSDLVKILTQDEIDWVSTIRIPYNGGSALWAKKRLIDAKVMDAIKSGVVIPVIHKHTRRTSANVISDTLDGIVNPVNGKRYDSKSKYYADVKAAGCHVMGGDAKAEQKKYEGNHDVSKELKQALHQVLNH